MGQVRPQQLFRTTTFVLWILTVSAAYLPLPNLLIWSKDIISCTSHKASDFHLLAVPGTILEVLAVLYIRYTACALEETILTNLELQWVQRTWAASFWDIEISGTAPRPYQPSSDVPCEGSSSSTADVADSVLSQHPGKSSKTMADAALQRSRPTFAIKALIYHVVSCIISAVAFSYLCRQILMLQCQPPGTHEPPSALLANLAYALSHNFWLSFFAHLALLTTLEMAFRVMGSFIYLLDWALLAFPIGIQLPRSLAGRGKTVAHKLVLAVPWATLVLWAVLVLFGTVKGLIMFSTSQIGASMPSVLWIACVIYLLAPFVILCRTIGMHYRTIWWATTTTFVFCRSRLAALGHATARIARTIMRMNGQIRLPSSDEEHLEADEGTIAL